MSISKANTIFETLSGTRLVNWGRLIQKLVEKSIPHIGKKPLPLSPYILHLYQHHGCVNEAEEDTLTIAEDKVAYKLPPEVELIKAGTEESLSDLTISEPPLAMPVHNSQRPAAPPT